MKNSGWIIEDAERFRGKLNVSVFAPRASRNKFPSANAPFVAPVITCADPVNERRTLV